MDEILNTLPVIDDYLQFEGEALEELSNGKEEEKDNDIH